MNLPTATFLVCHGSRDRRSQLAAKRLFCVIKDRLHEQNLVTSIKTEPSCLSCTSNSDFPIELGFLECTEIPLHQQLITFAEKVIAEKIANLQVFPLFLSAGVHVKEDIPSEVEIAQNILQSRIKIDLKGYLGALSEIYPILSQKFAEISSQERILLAHGSRRWQGNQKIERMATQMDALPAYWSIKPDLGDRIQELNHKDCLTIAIVPYFLFSGGIMESVQQQIEHLQRAFPHLTLLLGHPLDANPQLVQLIVKEIQK